MYTFSQKNRVNITITSMYSEMRKCPLDTFICLYDLSVLCIMACKPSKLYIMCSVQFVDLSNFEIAKMSANFEIA